MSTGKTDLKAKIAAGSRQRPTERMQFCGQEVEVRGMMTGERNTMVDVAYQRRGKELIPIYAKLAPNMLIRCIYDPTTGEPVFGPDDVDLINSLEPDEVQKAVDVINRISGLDKEALREAGKGSAQAAG